MKPSQAAELLRAAEQVKALHAEIGKLRARIGQLSDHLGCGDVAWTLQARGKGETLTIAGYPAQRMLGVALASLRMELKQYDDALTQLPMPAPAGE